MIENEEEARAFIDAERKRKTMKNAKTDPFAEFAKLDRGKPFLHVVRNKQTMHVHWGDGSLRDYALFSHFVDDSGLIAEVEAAWKRHRDAQRRRKDGR